jgi:hypothetical protein
MAKFIGSMVLLLCMSCDPPVRQALQTQAEPPGGIEAPQDVELCAKLTGKRAADEISKKTEEFINKLIKRLCSGDRLKNLREIKFSGNGNAEVMIEDKSRSDLDDQSEVRFYSALAVKTTAKSYYKMMRLQVSKPDDFSKAGFKSKEEVEYKVINGGAGTSETVEYEYYDNSERPEVEIGYAARAVFKTIISSELYVVGTTKTKTFETVQELQAFTVIHKTNISGSEGAEVFSISLQILDNNGDHDTVVSKTKNSLRKEVEMSYENSSNAEKADEFFVPQKN